MTRKLTLARRIIMAGVCSAFVFVGIASLSAQELTLTDEDMQYNAGMKSITVDGDISDWSGLPVKKAIPFEQGGELVLFEEYGGGTWSGPEDHTSAVSFAWDADNLYVGVVVTDDTHQNPGNGWNGDSIQMVFANAAQDTVTHLYNYALSDGGDIVIHNEKGPGGTELAVTRDEDTTTTSYEIKVPAESLGLDAFELDMQIGIGLCINDGDTDDGQGGQKGWSGWGPYAAVYGKTASATGLVTLTAKHDAVPGRPMVTKLVDFGSDDETINGVTGQPSPEPWISITKLVMDEPFDLGDAITITARDDGFNPNNPAPPNADDEYDGILVPESARNDYFFKITDTAGTEARMQIDGLPAGKYNITVFEGRETDSSQFAKIWTGDAEPDAENTGNFAKGGATVEVTVAAGQSLWYNHLEDNTGGVSGMMIRQTSQPIDLPYISKFTKGAGGFTVQLTDEATVGVDPDSVVVSVDGAEVTVVKSKAEGVTTVNYTAVELYESGSEHIMNLSYVGTDGVNRSFEKSFSVKVYSLIDPAIRVPDSMKGESGFLVYATQISTAQGVGNLHGNSWRNAEKQIQGGYHNPDADEPYINEADPDSFEGWTYYPEIVEVVNQNQDAPTGIGNFQANDKGNSTDREDEPITGIPGWGDSTDGIASEYLALLELPAGSHTFGVNSDDGFSASFAGNFLDMEQQQVGLFDGGRGAATSTFIVHVQEPGLYPFRVSWWEGGGGANIEIFSTVGKEKVLINDPDVEGSIKAWTPKGAVTDEQVTERVGTGRAYISGLSPVDGGFAGTKTIELTVVNGSVSTLDEGSVKFSYDGEEVTHSVVKDGDTRAITYDATSGGNGKHTALVEFADSDGNKRSVEWSFTLADPLIPGMPNPIAFWDFNFNQNPASAVDHVNGRIGDVVGGVYIDDTPSGEEGDYAMDFKASGAHVNVIDGEFLNIVATVDQISVSFWQKNYSIPSTASFKGVSTGSSHRRGFFAHVPWSNGHIYWDTAGCCDGNSQRITADANDIGGWPGEALDQWHHYVFVKNGSEKSIWVDGEFFHEGTNTGPLPMDMTTLVIGADENGASGVHGAIDDFAIFASALNEDQIIALSEGDRGILPKEPGYPLLASVSPSGLATGEDALQVTLVKRVDAIADTSLTVNGEAVDLDVATEGNTTTLTGKSNPSKIGINSATVSYNGREHAWSYFNYGESLKDGGENLIASWDFESGTKDSVYGLEGELLNDAALVEMDDRKVLDLSGSGSATMKVVTGDLLDLTAERDQVTVSFWQKFKSIGNTSSFNGDSPSSGSTRGFHAHAPWGSGAIYWDTVGCCDGSTQRINKDNPGFDYKQWHHYAFVKDKGKKSIWVDGQLFHEGNNSLALPMDMSALWVGSTSNGGGSINGAIDDFKVFAQALTGGQIAGQYFQGQAIVINITEQPASATATLDWDHVFTVKAAATADGEPLADSQLNYQWYLNGAAIDGANGSSFRTGLLSTADDGGKYSVMINQGGVSLSSEEAVLAVAKDNSAPGLAVANATQPELDSGGGAALRFNGGGNYVSVEADIVESDYTVEFWFRTEDPNAGLYCVVDQNLVQAAMTGIYIWSTEIFGSGPGPGMESRSIHRA